MEGSDETGSTPILLRRKIRMQFPVRVFADPPAISVWNKKTISKMTMKDLIKQTIEKLVSSFQTQLSQ
jgi:hypothetical protein